MDACGNNDVIAKRGPAQVTREQAAPLPMKAETRIELEADARARGFHLVGGAWMKLF